MKEEFQAIYYPADSVSEELLKSIPKKVYHMLLNLGVDLSDLGSYGKLQWEFVDGTGSTITFSDEEQEKFIQIWWDGHVDEATNICSNCRSLEDIINNINFFATVEEDIYSELQSMEEDDDR